MNNRFGTRKDGKKLLGVVAFLLLFATFAAAQAGRGGISGLVSDPSGASVGKAKVTALNHATGVSESTVSTAAGLYSFVSLNPGSYSVTATAQGFETTVRDNVTVSVDQVSTVNIGLKVGSVNEVVTVTQSSDLMENSNSTVGQLIDAQTIDRVPLFSRDVFQLIQLSAGVLPANGTPNSSDTTGIPVSASPRPTYLPTPSTGRSRATFTTCWTVVPLVSRRTIRPPLFQRSRCQRTEWTSTAWRRRTLRPLTRAAAPV